MSENESGYHGLNEPTRPDMDLPTVRELVIALRGPPPERCDFCDQITLAEDMHPEEAGMWACIGCISRWEEQDRR